MRRGAIFSSFLHVAIILLAVFGLPVLTTPPPVIEEPIPVEMATIAEKTNTPPLARKPEPKPEPPKVAPPLPPAPPLPEPPKVETPAPPPPKPQPQQVAAVPPPPEPPPEPLPTPMAEKKPEPQPQPQQATLPTPPLPPPPVVKPKQQPPDTTLEKILKSVEQQKPPPAPPDPAQKVMKQVAQATPPPSSSLDSKMTMSEIDAVRKQIERCWNVPAGAKDAKDLVVEIHVTLNTDGSVREARIVDQSRLGRDTFFRAAAESAYRAIFLCQPLHLPPDKYTLWQDMTLSFNPGQIL